MTRAMKDCMNIKHFTDHGEEDAERETICQHAPNVPIAINNAK